MLSCGFRAHVSAATLKGYAAQDVSRGLLRRFRAHVSAATLKADHNPRAFISALKFPRSRERGHIEGDKSPALRAEMKAVSALT